MSTLIELRRKLVEAYSEDDQDYGKKAIWTINKYFAEMKQKSKLDPTRLNGKSVFISKLRYALLEKVGPVDVDGHPDFNQMEVKEQVRFQSLASRSGKDKWVLSFKIWPDNIKEVRMTDVESASLKAQRGKQDMDKLKDDVREVDGDRLLEKLGPNLVKEVRWNALVAALLVVTGRRSAEILKTAEFYLADGQTKDGFECMFKGQAKAALEGKEPFRIPLLAPFSVVHAALARVRSMVDATHLTTEQVNAGFAKGLNNYTTKACGLTPHELRAAYAVMTYSLLKGKKPSLIGHIASVLGHVTQAAPSYYQRCAVTVTGPYIPPTDLEQEETAQDEDDGWVVKGKRETQRKEDIKEMMTFRKKITASSVREFTGASMQLIHRILLNNRELIDKYNLTLGTEGELFAKVREPRPNNVREE